MLPGADILEVETADGVKLPIPLFHYSTPGPTCPLKQCTVQCQTPTNQRKTNTCKCKSSYLSHYSTPAPACPLKQCPNTHKQKRNTDKQVELLVQVPPLYFLLLVHSGSVKHPQTRNWTLSIADQDLNMTEIKDTCHQPSLIIVHMSKYVILNKADYNGVWCQTFESICNQCNAM